MKTENTFFLVLGLCLALLAATAASAATIQLRAALHGAQEVPPNLATPATGTGVMTFDTVTRQLTWTINFSNLQSAISDAHFHGPTPAGVDAGIQVPIGPGVSPLIGAATLTVQQAAELLAGQYYINIHTANLPGGEIRGQVLPVRNDFNADGNSDILWRNTDGTNYVWQVNGASILGGVLAISSQGLLPGVDTSWAVAGVGDFNGDGKLDIFWRRNDGTNYIWHVDGATINGGVLAISSQGLLPTVDTSWTVVGIGDFNGDGKSDILWRKNDGTNYVWHVDGATINGGVLSITSQGLLPTVDTTWNVVGVGDFNGDGKSDVLWRKSDGTNYVWHVDGTTINGGVLAIASQGLLPGVDTSWSVVGIGDFNGEGRSDVLWRKSDGTNYVWHVNGGTITGGVLAIFSQGLLPGVTDLGWSVVGVADNNGDGKSDIFWRHTDGTNYVWHVDGATIISGVLAISSQGLLPGVGAGAGWNVAGRPAGQGKADVIFAIDTTGSMGGEITNLKVALTTTIIPQIRASLPDVAFGLVDFRDFGEPGGQWVVKYPHRIQTVFTSAGVNSIQTAVNSLAAGGGGDTPEAGWEAMYSIAGGPPITVMEYTSTFVLGGPPLAGETHGTVGGAAFRSGALPIVIAITDAEWHDAPGSGGLNPYGPELAGVPSRAQAIARLNAINARVISIVSSDGGGAARTQGQLLAEATGATVLPAAWGDNRPVACGVSQCCTGANGAGEAPSSPESTCPLVYTITGTGAGLGSAIVDGVHVLIRAAP